MKALLSLILCVSSSCLFGQSETFWWAAGNNVLLDFNGGSPTHSFSSALQVNESCAAISDNSGSLLFYTDGEKVWGSSHAVLTNGDNLAIGANTPFSPESTTQGSVFVQNPTNPDLYYLISLGSGQYEKNRLEYAVIDNSTQTVLNKNNLLFSDTLTEKMTVARHCNGQDYWLIIVNCENHSSISQQDYTSQFLSFRITANGIHSQPVLSTLDLEDPVKIYGQMKMNNQGNELAVADGTGISLFDFDNSTGEVQFKQRISLDLQNGYGIEYSPNDRFLYVNEKQYDFQTGILTQLLDYNCPSQIQRGPDRKLYKMHVPESEIVFVGSDNGWGMIGNTNNSFRLSQIANPDLPGNLCDLDTTFIYDNQPFYNGSGVGLPNIPSYMFNSPKAEFDYTNVCSGEWTNLTIQDTPEIDSVSWFFPENNQANTGFDVNHMFPGEGDWQVMVIVHGPAGIDTLFYCVTICGPGSDHLPNVQTICPDEEITLDAWTPCAMNYVWNTGENQSTITIADPGIYIVESQTNCGIISDTVVILEGDCSPLIKVPNVFTPNDDLINDVVVIDVRNASSLTVMIFNRWGNTVQSDTYMPSGSGWTQITIWNGKDSNGEVYNDGTYFYKIEATGILGQSIVKSGFIQLSR